MRLDEYPTSVLLTELRQRLIYTDEVAACVVMALLDGLTPKELVALGRQEEEV